VKDVTIQNPTREPPPLRQKAVARQSFLFATADEWSVVVAVAAVVSLLCYPYYQKVSLWIGPGLCVYIGTLCHFGYAARNCIPVGHLTVLICGLQMVLAPWWGYYHPMSTIDLDIGDNLPNYLAYAVPCFLALTGAWGIACVGLPVTERRYFAGLKGPQLVALQQELDWFLFGGLGVGLLGGFVYSGSFVVILLGNFRFVGAFGWMLIGGKGWRWRVACVLFVEAVTGASTALLHGLVVWMALFLCFYIYRFRPRPFRTVSWLFAGLLLLPAMEYGKLELRKSVWAGQAIHSRLLGDNFRVSSSLMWPVVLSAYIVDGAVELLTGQMNEEFLGHLTDRYSQGWIANRVMLHVPDHEPYAEGETIVTAFIDAFLPRVLVPKAYVAGGREAMRRFADLELGEGVSMNLGYVGEMYANFGYYGGILGVGVYGLVLGLLFRWVYRKAKEHPLWWAIVPYVSFTTIRAEDGIEDIVNWVAKATGVAFLIVVSVCPSIRASLLMKGVKPQKLLRDRFRATKRLDEGGGVVPGRAPGVFGSR